MIRLTEVSVKGYRALANFHAKLGPLTVIVGPNACGKSTLLDVLVFLSEAAVGGSVAEPIGRRGGLWSVGSRDARDGFTITLALRSYVWSESPEVGYALTVERGFLLDPVVAAEVLAPLSPEPVPLLSARSGKGTIKPSGLSTGDCVPLEIEPHQLALSAIRDPARYWTQFQVQRYLGSWRIYAGFDVAPGALLRFQYKLGSSSTGDQYLASTGENLAGMISRLRSEVSLADHFAELQDLCRTALPEFKSVGTRRSVTGSEEIVEWQEAGGATFHAGELSDGILRFLCLAVLCVSPNPPPLVGIDEPELGLHPKLLPIVAAMLRGLSERTQVIVLTHSPQLLNGFELEEVAVMSKDETGAHLHRPVDRPALKDLLRPVIGETIAGLFESGELEIPPEPTEATTPAGERAE